MMPTTLYWGIDRDKQLALDLQDLNKLEFLVLWFGDLHCMWHGMLKRVFTNQKQVTESCWTRTTMTKIGAPCVPEVEDNPFFGPCWFQKC